MQARFHKIQSFQGNLNILKMSEINSSLQKETPEKNNKELKSSEVLQDKTKPDLKTFVSQISRITMSLLKIHVQPLISHLTGEATSLPQATSSLDSGSLLMQLSPKEPCAEPGQLRSSIRVFSIRAR